MLPSIDQSQNDSLPPPVQQPPRQYYSILRQDSREEYESRVKDQLNKLDTQKLINSYQKENIKISPLTSQQYQSIARESQIELLNPLPKLESDIRKSMPFLKFSDITMLSQSVVEDVQKSRDRHKEHSLFRKADNQATLNFSKMGNTMHTNSDYSQQLNSDESRHQFHYVGSVKDRLQMHLVHNHEAMNQMRKVSQNMRTENLQEITQLSKKISHNINQGRFAKCYPSKKHQEEQQIEIMKRQIQMGQELSPRQIVMQTGQLSAFFNKKQTDHQTFFYPVSNLVWSPSAREGLTLVSSGSKLYMYGGMGVRNQEELFEADVKKAKIQWRKIQLHGDYAKGGYYARFDHVSVIYRNNMFVFGGEIVQEKPPGGIRTRDIVNEGRGFNLNNGECKTYRSLGMIEARKAHASTLIGKYMIVHGGISIRNQCLGDLNILDVSQQKWCQIFLQPSNLFEKGISFHGAASVASQYARNPEIYKRSADNENETTTQEGVMFFGGIDTENNFYQDLIFLETCKKPMTYEVLKTQGMPPSGRYKHTMNYNELMGYLIICGGMNAQGQFLNDIHLLQVKSLQWMNILVGGKEFLPRCSHGSAVVDTKLYIFGGYNESGFLNADLEILELDSSVAKQQQELYKKAEESGITHKRGVVIQPKTDPVAVTPEQQKLNARQELIKQLSFRTPQHYQPSPPVRQSVLFLLRSQSQRTLTQNSNPEQEEKRKMRLQQIDEETRDIQSPVKPHKRTQTSMYSSMFAGAQPSPKIKFVKEMT